ncbi:MAG TPA: MASE2 domain-containing protein, partial [Rhodanobacteraceae bacterium]
MSPVIRPQSLQAQTLRFIAGVHVLRTLGLALGTLMIAMVFYRDHASPILWVLLIIYGLLWPHLARVIAQRHARPMHAERASILVDSAGGGIWIVA